MRRIEATALLTAFLLIASVAAGASESRPYWRWYVDDTVEIAKSSVDSSFWQKAVIMAGAAAAVHQFDSDIEDSFEKNRSKGADKLAKVGEAFGNGLYMVPAVLGAWGYGEWASDRKAVTAAKLALESFVLSGIAANGIKYATKRHRPKEGDGPDEWDFFSRDSSSVSFPSGHTTTAFALATVVAETYGGESVIVAPAAYGLAALTGLSRVYDREHWGSDVVFGALLGYFTSKALIGLHKSDSTVSVTPAPDGLGVALAVKF